MGNKSVRRNWAMSAPKFLQKLSNFREKHSQKPHNELTFKSIRKIKCF
jgi:hypothetical protein